MAENNIKPRVAKYLNPVREYVEKGHTAKEISGMMGLSYVTTLKYVRLAKEAIAEESIVDEIACEADCEIDTEKNIIKVPVKKEKSFDICTHNINGKEFDIRVHQNGFDIWYSYNDLDEAFSSQGYSLKDLEVPYIYANGKPMVYLWDVVCLSKVCGDIYFRNSMKTLLFGSNVYGDVFDLITSVNSIDTILKNSSKTKDSINVLTEKQDSITLSLVEDNNQNSLKEIFELIKLKETLKKELVLVKILGENTHKSVVLWKDLVDFVSILGSDIEKYLQSKKR